MQGGSFCSTGMAGLMRIKGVEQFITSPTGANTTRYKNWECGRSSDLYKYGGGGSSFGSLNVPCIHDSCPLQMVPVGHQVSETSRVRDGGGRVANSISLWREKGGDESRP